MVDIFLPAPTKWSRLYLIPFYLMLLVTLFVVGLHVYTLAGAFTMRYEVTEPAIVIHFGFQKVRIPREDVEQAWILEEPTRLTRLVGTTAPGLHQGRWSTRETGQLSLFASEARPLLVIKTRGRTYGITPDDPEAMLAAIEEGTPAVFPPAGDPSRVVWGLAVPLTVVVLLLIALTVGLYLLTARFRHSLRYELHPSELVIQTGWHPIRIPYTSIRGAEIVHLPGSPLRKIGTHLPGLLWGKFTWRGAGPNLHLYATQKGPLVLISLESRTIGISPAEPEAFLQELNQRRRVTRRS